MRPRRHVPLPYLLPYRPAVLPHRLRRRQPHRHPSFNNSMSEVQDL